MKNWNWSTRILSVAALGLVAAVLYPVFFRARESGGNRNGCQSNLKQIGLAVLQYAQDYDEKLPLVATGGSAYGWADVIQPYIKSTQLYQCPLEPTPPQANPGNPRESSYTDYPFNAHMSGKLTTKIPETALQILSLDGNDGTQVTDARYSLKQIPIKWQLNDTSPLYRHKGYANFLFADGHVKSIRPQAIAGFGGIGAPIF